jgi:DHA2 family methylenomycin A resistance protein-like MFS transporter
VVAEPPRQESAHLDLAGQLFGTGSLAAFVAGFIEAGHAGWFAPATLALLTGGAVAGAVFVAVEKRVPEPVLPLGMLKNRNFAVATGIGGLFNFCLYGTLFCLALYLQRAWSLGALAAGLALVPLTMAVGLNAFFSGRLTGRFGPRVPMVAGALAGLAGALGFALLPEDRALVLFVVASIVFGCCSLAMPAMTSLAVNALPGQAGLAAGVLNAARQTGGAIGVALVGALLPAAGMGLVAAGYALVAGLAFAVRQSS